MHAAVDTAAARVKMRCQVSAVASIAVTVQFAAETVIAVSAVVAISIEMIPTIAVAIRVVIESLINGGQRRSCRIRHACGKRCVRNGLP